jgi:uncharacterized protein
MLKNFPDFVPQDVCLKCQGCCRFQEHKSSWRPKITKEEIEEVGSMKIPQSMIDDQQQIKTCDMPKLTPFSPPCQCMFFDAEQNTCQIYSFRPFDCQLYPFLLLRKENKIFVGVHLNCPYVEKTRYKLEFKLYLEKLEKYFSNEELKQFLKRNSFLASDFKNEMPEIDFLFQIPLD